MGIDLSFEGVCKSLKNEFPNEIADDVDAFSSVILALGIAATAGSVAVATIGASASPMAIGVTAIGTLANLIATKDATSKLIHRIIEKASSKRASDPLEQIELQERAFRLLCYTAFFEALTRESRLKSLLKKVKITRDEKLLFSEVAAERLWGKASKSEVNNELSFLNYEIELPRPTDTFEQQKQRLQPLYQILAKGALHFFSGLRAWEEVKEEQQKALTDVIEELPKKADEYFTAQYYLLATRYNEFYIWSNLQEHEKTRKQQVQTTSLFLQKYTELAEKLQHTIDTGLTSLDEIYQIPERLEQYSTDRMLQILERKYTSVLEEPIFKDDSGGKDNGERDGVDLVYPPKGRIFIPQAFQVIHYTGKEQLGLDITWDKDKVPERDDLSLFLMSFFQSPHSAKTPLIILGHPGSGKTLLTSIIAARMVISSFTPIRVPLRDVDAGTSIATQIEKQLCEDTRDKEAKWIALGNHFKQKPALILFDGYDELLQATGRIFRDYLRIVQRFQNEEWALGYPIRTVVTSRITLINEAEIPKGATIIRLSDFDEPRQQQWLSIWNEANRTYFGQKNIQPFTVPQNNEKIKKLAAQPLLLTMLALYDSEGNQLHKEKEMDQTRLYNNLILRFIRRECEKSTDFKNQPPDRQAHDINIEKARLNVAAIGMFNRSAHHILQAQLEDDLKFFQLQPEYNSRQGRNDAGGWPLSQAQSVLNGFFFFPKAETRQNSLSRSAQDSNIVFEFLHKTFGEFLASDLILSQILQQIDRLNAVRSMPGWGVRTEYENILDDINKFSPTWFACLMYFPLFAEQNTIEMMREWLEHCLKDRAMQRKETVAYSKERFLEELDAIVHSHIRLLLMKSTLPKTMTEPGNSPFIDLPILGYIAIYTLNLILLRTMLSPDGYIFDEESKELQLVNTDISIDTPSTDTLSKNIRPWDRLTYLWRSWFPLESLHELAAIFSARREGNKIYLKIKEQFGSPGNDTRLSKIFNVNLALADNIVTGLAGLLLHDTFRDGGDQLDNIQSILLSENIDLKVAVFTKQIRHLRKEGKSIPVSFAFSFADPRFILNGNFDDLLNSIRDLNKYVSSYRNLLWHRLNRSDIKGLTRSLMWLIEHPMWRRSSELLIEEFFTLMRVLSTNTGIDREWDLNLLDELLYTMIHFTRLERRTLSPELALELLRLQHGIQNRRDRRAGILDDGLASLFKHSLRIRNWGSANPELILELLKFTRKSRDHELFAMLGADYLGPIMQSKEPQPIELVIEITSAAILLGYNNQQARSFYLRNIKTNQGAIQSLSMETVVMLRRLAVRFGDTKTIASIERVWKGE